MHGIWTQRKEEEGSCRCVNKSLQTGNVLDWKAGCVKDGGQRQGWGSWPRGLEPQCQVVRFMAQWRTLKGVWVHLPRTLGAAAQVKTQQIPPFFSFPSLSCAPSQTSCEFCLLVNVKPVRPQTMALGPSSAYVVCRLRIVLTFLRGLKKNKRRMTFCDTWAFYEIHMSMSINKVLLE